MNENDRKERDELMAKVRAQMAERKARERQALTRHVASKLEGNEWDLCSRCGGDEFRLCDRERGEEGLLPCIGCGQHVAQLGDLLRGTGTGTFYLIPK